MTKTISPFAAPLIKPTKNSFKYSIICLAIRQIAQRDTPYGYCKRLCGCVAAHTGNDGHIGRDLWEHCHGGIKMTNNRSRQICRPRLITSQGRRLFTASFQLPLSSSSSDTPDIFRMSSVLSCSITSMMSSTVILPSSFMLSSTTGMVVKLYWEIRPATSSWSRSALTYTKSLLTKVLHFGIGRAFRMDLIDKIPCKILSSSTT